MTGTSAVHWGSSCVPLVLAESTVTVQWVLAVIIASVQSVLVELHAPGRSAPVVQLLRWSVGGEVVPQQADSNFGVPLGSDSNVGDALTNAGASGGVVLQPVMSASEADASVVASKASLQLVLKLETAVGWQTLITLMMVASTLAVSELMVALLMEWLLVTLVWLSDECVRIVCWSCLDWMMPAGAL